jgi:hypothetical protein
MERDEAIKNLELIKNVVMETRREIGKSRPYLFWWGPLIIIASLIEQWFWLQKCQGWPPHLLLWGAFLIIGSLGSLYIDHRKVEQRGGKISNPLVKRVNWINSANFIFIWFCVFLSLVLHVFGSDYIWAMATLINGYALFVNGIILSDRGYIILSVVSFPVVILMVLYTIWQPAIFGIYLGGGYITLAFLLRDAITRGDN